MRTCGANMQNEIKAHNGNVNCLDVGETGRVLVTGADDIGIIRRWDLNAQTICSTLNGHMKSVRTLDFNPSGEYVVSGSNDTTVR
uniref:Uncharacterized protein n=1 Tax=Glossina palpalis gambiensis TaxID=67801 RepID=A0A1B0AYL9_9MUSC